MTGRKKACAVFTTEANKRSLLLKNIMTALFRSSIGIGCKDLHERSD